MSNDYWSINESQLIRHHVDRRTKLFTPNGSVKPPVPLRYIDVLRQTESDSEVANESTVQDVWYCTPDSEEDPERHLSNSWVGQTCFELLKPRPKPGYEWQSGRLTKVQTTSRPPVIWPEMWDSMSKSERQNATRQWLQLKEKIDPAREHRDSLGSVL